MSVKRELIALAIRIIASETNLVRKPDQFELFISHLFDGESYDQRMARNVEAELDRVTEAAKRMNVNRKFKKITQDF